MLRRAGLTWKKCKKLLGKADPQEREEFLSKLELLYQQMCDGEVTVIYIDESHFHRDLDLGYSWGPIGERLWRVSDCPSLSERINWYGAYNFTEGSCFIWNEGNCNTAHTSEFLEHVAHWAGSRDRRVIVIWDRAPWHRPKLLHEKAAELNMELIELPGYSPDLNPMEALWKWMREEVTQHHCYESLKTLFTACRQFIDAINKDPLAVVDRLWPRFELDPDMEELRFSF